MSRIEVDPRSPKGLALAAAAEVVAQATGLVEYRSGGHVLVVGEPEPVRAALAALPDPLTATGICTGAPAGPEVGVGLRVWPREQVVVAGHLGAFDARFGGPEAEPRHFDLVLDLCPEPLLAMPLKPPGYLAPGPAPEALAPAVEALAGLIGRFEKPQFFAYDPSICAHGARGIGGCRRCIDACPAAAIVSIGEKIEVDPYLCQGGGVCATTCPTGAITYRYPPAADTLERVRRMLAAYHAAGGDRAELLLHGAAVEPDGLGNDVLPLALEELASAGVEIWLSALAFGARAVSLWRDAQTAESVIALLDEQRHVANAILEAIGFAPAVRWFGSAGAGPASMPAIERAGFAASAGGKRPTLFMAIDHLYRQAPKPVAEAALPAGAPLGRIRVDRKGCTLCLACASVCPAKALSDGGDRPALRFYEQNCVQCGLCAAACPEHVVTLEPRVLYDARLRREPVTLHEEEPFCCVSCGKPFATRSALDKVLERLAGHPMFQDEASRRRLMMCDDCRVVDMMRDEARR
ncbi:MAG: 4Fe-4S binding protein [Burkholderiales bacterium]|nr:MAG: 4Fe-4S binding protein [Burkholderiales bacterium]